MTDPNDYQQNMDDDHVSLDELDPTDHSNDNRSPADADAASASGHAPDLESDDDVDFLGDEAGVIYSDDEELGIDQKVQVTTTPEPPTEDTPY